MDEAVRRPAPVQVRLVGRADAVAAAAQAIGVVVQAGPMSVRPSRYGGDAVRGYLDVVVDLDAQWTVGR